MKRHRRRKSRLRPIALIAAGLLLACVGAVAFLLVDQTALKARLAEAVLRATGRVMVFTGKLTIEPGAELVLAADDVALGNPPGFSRPEMARVGRIEARLAWLPLLDRQVVIRQLSAHGASVLLEKTAGGLENWTVGRPVPEGARGATGVGGEPGKPWSVDVREFTLRDSDLRWLDGSAGRDVLLRVRDMSLAEPAPGAALVLNGDVEVGGVAGHLSGDFATRGALASSAAPWPVQLIAETAMGRLSATGSVSRPVGTVGYDLTLEAKIPALSALSGLAGMDLPNLRDVVLNARVVDSGTGRPDVSGVVLHAGATDLEASGYGTLHLDHLDIAVPRLDAPVEATLEGAFAGTPFGLVGTLGPGLLTGGAHGPFPIDLRAEAAGGMARVFGAVARPPDLAGLDLTLAAEVPDLAALSPVAGTALPGFKGISLKAHVTGGDAGAVVIRDIALASPQGDLSGAVAWRPAAPGVVQADLVSRRFDLDAIRATFAAAPAPSRPAAEAGAPTIPASAGRRVIPDTELPFAALNRIDGDIRWSIDELRVGGMTFAEFVAHAVLNRGKLVLDPVGGQGATGRVDFFASVDAMAASPRVAVTLRGNGLAIKPLLTASHWPDDVTGDADLSVDLRASGRTPRALAATLDGYAALAIADGEMDNNMLTATLGGALRAARLPADFGQGKTTIRCLAVRLEASHGVVSATTLLLDTSRLLLQGSGDANLGDEGLALRFRPQLRVGAPGLTVPLRIGGSFAEPKPGLDSGGMLGAFMAGERRPPDTCAPALASARRR